MGQELRALGTPLEHAEALYLEALRHAEESGEGAEEQRQQVATRLAELQLLTSGQVEASSKAEEN